MALLLPIKEEETEEIDPEEELKNRLIEYEKYKESRQIFETLREKRNQYFTKAPEKFDLYTNKTLTNNGNVSANDLLKYP